MAVAGLVGPSCTGASVHQHYGQLQVRLSLIPCDAWQRAMGTPDWSC